MFGGMETITPRQIPGYCLPLEARLEPTSKTQTISNDSYAWKWTLALLAVGMAWRMLRYFLQFPVWGDEAFIGVNFLDRDYLGLLKPLDYKQVAPIWFLWSELFTFRMLGGSELAIRLLPFLSGLGSLFLFWRLAKSTLDSASALLAVGIFAVSYYPIRHSCEVKPYAFDLFWSLALLVQAVNWLGCRDRWGWLALLVVLVPLALGASYPAVFVAGAICLVLLKPVWQQRSLKSCTLFGLYNLAMGISFLISNRIAGVEQFDSTGGTANWYWSDWFPPIRPMELMKWLVSVHTGNMMAYPAGGFGGASALTLILFLVGIRQLWRDQNRSILFLCLIPFGLTFIAAAMHRYPYGGSARVAQHLAPAICLLAGAGAGSLISRFAQSEISRRRSLAVVSLILSIIAVWGMVRDWNRPYKSPADAQLRDIVMEVSRQAKQGDQIVVMDSPQEVASPFVWYLRQLKDRVAWRGQIDWDRLNDSPPCDLWCLYLTRDLSRRDTMMASLVSARNPMVLAGHEEYSLQFGQTDDTLEHFEVFHWIGLKSGPCERSLPSEAR
jgi:hypothetical protein